ncbi:MAG TPA: rhomboid family intramembrane serine protease [Leucothrix mucor]|nr:rhomboid family intramembrane serine protease [Leucothrix mucor]
MKIPFTTVNVLIAINILIFFIASAIQGGLDNQLALYFTQNSHFAPWQFFTHMFMHGSITHLLFNMFALWMFGSQLETVWGGKRFLIFYFICGIGAALIYTGINTYQFNAIYSLLSETGLSSYDIQSMIDKNSYPPAVLSAEQAGELLSIYHAPMVGASGAIYGVLVAFAFIFPNHKLMLIFLPFPIAAKYFVPALISLDLFSGVTGMSIFGGGVAHFAHVGGAVIGFLMMFYWRKKLG